MRCPSRPDGTPWEGILPVDKPIGPTSHDIVLGVRRALGESRVGHTGTLDPFASGLLLLCLGRATRLSQYLTGLDKEYLASVQLGLRTTTDDGEGSTLEEGAGWRDLSGAEVEEALSTLRGTLLQTPPLFSAKKVGGEAAHRRARRGEALDLRPVEVTVHELELVGLSLPLLDLRVHCSSGTYVRSLARDLGERLGVGGYLAALRRTRVGSFRVEDATPPRALTDAHVLLAALIDPARALAHMPSVDVDAEDARRLAHGQAVAAPHSLPVDGPVLALRGGSLVAVVSREGGTIRPRKVFAGGVG